MRKIPFKLTRSLWPEKQRWIDAIRNTLSVLVPLIVLFYSGQPDLAIGIGTGALLVGLADLPGNRSDKMLGAWTSLLVCWLAAVLISISLESRWILCLSMTAITFIFTMFACFGQRLAAVGAIGLVVASFTIGLSPQGPMLYGAYIVIGGIWYYLISLLQVWLFPFHSLLRAIHVCTRATAELLRLRAMGYDPSATLSGFNQRNITLHLKLTASHELIRRLLLGDRYATSDKNHRASQLLNTSILLIDLYERISTLHNDYPYLRRKLTLTGALPVIHETIILLAQQLEKKGGNELRIKKNIEKLAGIQISDIQTAVLLKKIISNLEQTVSLALKLTTEQIKSNSISIADFEHFIQPDGFSIGKLRLHLKLSSPILRFSIRLSVLMFVSVLFIGLFPKGSYCYWIPLTLLVVSKPSFVHTSRRNFERVLGTFGGLFISWALLHLVASNIVLLTLGSFSIFIFFLFLYSRYWIAAIGVTIAVVLCLSVYHGNAEHILLDRLLFTILGCMLGIVAPFFFPIWHSKGLKAVLLRTFEANRDFLMAKERDDHNLKLVRKEAYLALALLSEGISLSIKEPLGKTVNAIALRQLELLCFQCNGLISALIIDTEDCSARHQYKSIIANLNLAISGVQTIELDQLKTNIVSPNLTPLILTVVVERIRAILEH